MNWIKEIITNWNYNIFFAVLCWLIFAAVFYIYSFIGLSDLKNYGYIGDACKKVRLAYTLIAGVVLISSIILFLII